MLTYIGNFALIINKMPTEFMKPLRLVFSLLCIISLYPKIAAQTVIDDIIYSVDTLTMTAQVSDYQNSPIDVVIPPTIEYSGDMYSVTKIGRKAFNQCTSLKSLEIPNSVIEIDKSAFSNCNSLESLVLVSGKSRLDGASQSGLTSCPIRSMYIGRYIGGESIINKDSIRNLTIAGNADYPKLHGCTSLQSVTIESSKSYIAYEAFWGCTGLTSIDIPNSVTEIGGKAFYGCTGLTSIDIPNSVTKINGSTFYNCTGLTRIDIPNSVTSIGPNVFRGCTGLTRVDIPNSVTSIGSTAFQGCTSLTSIDIPNSVTEILGAVFHGCTGLKSIVIPNSVNELQGTFSGCTGLTNIVIPNSVDEIGSHTFYGCRSLASIDIPISVNEIDDYTFYGCTSLKSIVIPKSVAEIKLYAFGDCTGLKSITCLPSTPPQLDRRNFSDEQYSNIPLYVPEDAISAYQAADYWKNFKNIKAIETSGIESLELKEGDVLHVIYDLKGRRLREKQKGLNIINGEKVLER